VVAAFLHLGYIDEESDILALNLFNNVENLQLGELIPIGMDDKGRDIFVIGSKKAGKILSRTLVGIAKIYGFSADSVQFIDLNSYYNYTILLGIFFMRKLKLYSVGKRLVFMGIKKNFERLKDVIQRVRDKPLYIEKEVNR